MSFLCGGVGEEDDEIAVDVGFFNENPGATVVCLEDEGEVEIEVDRFPVEEDPLADVNSIESPDDDEEEVAILTESVPKAQPVVTSAPKEKYQRMTLAEFEAEMDKSVKEIVAESLVLFDKDPREYHPFYLRIFKYLLIGKNLGFVGNSGKWSELQIWRKYDQFAESQLELKTKGVSLILLGEQSAYATYILTKKVVINGQRVQSDKKWNDKERMKSFARLDRLVGKIRREWNGGDEDDGGIKEDLKTRLEFFKECQRMTHPSEVVKMNNLWKKLLDEEGLVKRKKVEDKPKEDNLKTEEQEPEEVKPIVVKVKVLVPSSPSPPPCPPSPACSPKPSPPPSPPSPACSPQPSPPPSPSSPTCSPQPSPPSSPPGPSCSPQPSPPPEDFPEEVDESENLQLSDDKPSEVVKTEDKPKQNTKLVKKTPLKRKIRKGQKLKLARKWQKLKSSGAPLLLKRKLKRLKRSMITQKAPQTTLTPLQTKLERIIVKKKLILPLKIPPKPKATEDKQLAKVEPSTKMAEETDDISNPEVKSKSGGPPSLSCICDECGHVVPNPYQMAVHKKRRHNPDHRHFPCPFPSCTKIPLRDARGLWTHYTRMHMDLNQLCPEIAQVTELKTGRKATVQVELPKGPRLSGPGGTCHICGKYLSTLLERHIQTQHGNGLLKENYMTCPYCSKEFKQKCILTAHIKRYHELTEIIKCSVCGKSCGSSGKLWKHRVEDHELSPEEEAKSLGIEYEFCQFCGKVVQKGRALRFHVEREHGEEYPDWWRVEERRRKEEKTKVKKRVKFEEDGGIDMEEEEETSGRWVCPKTNCRDGFRSKKNLQVHLLEVHCNVEERVLEEKLIRFAGRSGIYQRYVCTLCDKWVYDRGEVRTHIVHCHPDIYQCVLDNSPFPKPELKCAHCSDGRFTEEEELRKHIESCHGELCWRCPECSKVMLSSEEMMEHFEEDHGNGNKVEKKKERSMFKLHGRPVPNDRRTELYAKYRFMKTECEICGKSLSFDWIPKHLKSWHDGLVEDGELWKCPVCPNKRYTQRHVWLGHMEMRHETEVNMEEMVEIAKKINTKEDWRTMGVKTIERFGNGKIKKVKVSTGPIDKAAYSKKKTIKKGTRKVVRTKSGRTVNLKKFWEPDTTTERKGRKVRACVVRNNLEKKKRLIILVERLNQQEILKWRNKNEVTLKTESCKKYD